MLENGLFLSNAHRKGRRKERVARLKGKVAKAFEESLVMRWLECLYTSLLYGRTRTYGAFLLSLGTSGTLVYIVREFIFEEMQIENGNWIFTLGCILLSVPLLMYKKTLSRAVVESALLPSVLFRYLGCPRESFLSGQTEPKRYGVASALGVTLGMLTYFISPVYYLICFATVSGILMILRRPERGILFLAAILPVAHYTGHAAIVLSASVLLVDVAYFLKWIRGKRVWEDRLIDCGVLAIGVLLILNGIVSIGGRGSLETALIFTALLSVYWVTVNLLHSSKWIKKTWMTMLFAGLFSCISGVLEMFTGTVNASWVDMRSFSETVRVTGGFENPNVYAEYLLVLIPLSFLFLLERKTTLGRCLAIGVITVLGVCMVNTWSRGAWLGLVVAAVSYWLIMDKHSPVYLLAACLVLPWTTDLLPRSVFSRILSIGDLADSSISYRFSVWRGVWRMLRKTFFCGTGVGYSAFSALYPAFAYGGSVGVRHAHSFYLQILVEFGIVGFIIVAAVLFLFVQMCLEYFFRMQNKQEKRFAAAGSSSVLGLLVMGLTDHIWYDCRIFFCFWLLIGLVSAHVRVTLAAKERRGLFLKNTAEAASIQLDVIA